MARKKPGPKRQAARGGGSRDEPENLESAVPPENRGLFAALVGLTDAFCDARLNDEYKELCRRMAVLVCQEDSPAAVGRAKLEGWAAGIVYVVGWVNFLTDPSQTPHLTAAQIAEGFGVSEATMHNRVRPIRDGLDLMRFQPEFTLPSRMDDNPFIWMLSVNGFIMDIRSAPRGAQVAAFEAGLIPYVPADREAAD